MKKGFLLSVVASAFVMAGGDVAPAPVAEVSPWTVSGDVKLFYRTDDFSYNDNIAGMDFDLFEQGAAFIGGDGSTGQGAVNVDVSYAFADTWKVNAGITGLATFGLDDSVVSNVWLFAGADAGYGEAGVPFTSVGDALWIDTFNVTGTILEGKTTIIAGRTELDTPLVFTETWNIANNTFDAVVAMDNHIENLTLVGGYIYDGNGNGAQIGTMKGGFTSDDGYMGLGEPFDAGAWTVGGIYKYDALVAQAWYYDVIDVAQAVWLQGDYAFNSFNFGAQYAMVDADDLMGVLDPTVTETETTGFAVKGSYAFDAFGVWAAYSAIDDEGVLAIANTATMMSGAGFGPGQSKLYTEAWWNYGYVGAPDAESFAIAGTYKYNDSMDFLAQYTGVENETLAADMAEIALVGNFAYYGVDLSLAYVNTDVDDTSVDNADWDADSVQAYITYKF